MSTPAQRSDPLGFDLAVGPPPGGGQPDMTSTGRSCSGVELVRNALIARSMNDTISMIGAPGDRVAYGIDVRNWVGSATTPDDIETRQQRLAIVYARDPRIDAGSLVVKVTVPPPGTPIGAQYAFLIQVTARTTTNFPIALVMGISSVTVDGLAQGGLS